MKNKIKLYNFSLKPSSMWSKNEEGGGSNVFAHAWDSDHDRFIPINTECNCLDPFNPECNPIYIDFSRSDPIRLISIRLTSIIPD